MDPNLMSNFLMNDVRGAILRTENSRQAELKINGATKTTKKGRAFTCKSLNLLFRNRAKMKEY